MADTVGGMCAGLGVLPGWVVSTNLMLRTVPAAHAAPLRLRAEIVRAGRTSVVTDVGIRDGDGTVVADGVLTSAVLEPAGGPPEFARPLVLEPPDGPDGAQPVLEFFGVRPTEAGGAELDITDRIRNPWGILHGGAIAVLVDAAAGAVVGDGTVADVVLHFLRPGRVGPAVARARVLGRRPDGVLVHVEVVDGGAADRVMAIAVCTVRPG
jgi:acyl-coenzyme A thioesterase PaaI-like protein